MGKRRVSVTADPQPFVGSRRRRPHRAERGRAAFVEPAPCGGDGHGRGLSVCTHTARCRGNGALRPCDSKPPSSHLVGSRDARDSSRANSATRARTEAQTRGSRVIPGTTAAARRRKAVAAPNHDPQAGFRAATPLPAGLGTAWRLGTSVRMPPHPRRPPREGASRPHGPQPPHPEKGAPRLTCPLRLWGAGFNPRKTLGMVSGPW